MNTKQHVDKTLVLFCNLQVDKLIEPKNSKNSTENAQVPTIFLIDVLSPLSTTQCPNRLCLHQPSTPFIQRAERKRAERKFPPLTLTT